MIQLSRQCTECCRNFFTIRTWARTCSGKCRKARQRRIQRDAMIAADMGVK